MPKFAFADAARQRSQTVATVPFATNQRTSVEMPRVGFVSAVHLCLKGSLTRNVGDTGAFSPRLWNILQRVGFSLNLGANSVVDMSGYGLYTQNNTLQYTYGPDLGGSIASLATGMANGSFNMAPGVFRADATVPAAPTATPFVLSWWIPIAQNMGPNATVGLINLQAQEVRATVDILFGSVADLFPAGSVLTGTSIAANLTISYVFFEVPNPQNVLWPPLLSHRLLEEKMPFGNTGDLVYTIPPQGTLQRWCHNVVINGAPAQSGSAAGGDVTQLIVRVNKTDDFYRQTPEFAAELSRQRLGHSLPEGCFLHDMLNSSSLVDAGTYRDTINSEAIATLESILTVNAASVLGVGNNFVETWRDIVQPLAY